MTNELAIRIITGDVLGTSEQTQEAIIMAVKALSMPSAQLEQAVKDCRNCKHGKYNDYHDTYFCYNPENCSNWEKWETSAQPEIIRCKDCKYASPNGQYGCKAYHFKQHETHEMYADDFCSKAERREDE